MTAPELDPTELDHHVRRALDSLGVAAMNRPHPFPIPAAASAGLLYAGAAIVYGWSIANTGAAAGGMVLLDGGDLNGQPAGRVLIPAGDSRTAWFGPQGIVTRSGLFHTSDAGITGAIFLAPARHGS